MKNPKRIAHSKLSLVITGLLAGSGAVAQNDLVIRPPAGGSVIIEDSSGNQVLLRVDENGILQLPSVSTSPEQDAVLCMDVASGQIGPCSDDALINYSIGTGLEVVDDELRLRTDCVAGQFLEFDGAQWNCAPEMGPTGPTGPTGG